MDIQNFSKVPEEAKRPVWFNGRLVEWENAALQVATHAVNYGSGVFEGIRFYETSKGPAIFHLDAHLERLSRSRKLFQIESPYSVTDMKQACVQVAKASGARSGYLRPQVQFGLSKLSLGATDIVDTIVVFWPLGKYREAEGLNAVTSEVQRISPKAMNIEAKVTGFYTNSYFNRLYYLSQGADEAVMLDINGNVAEGGAVNVFFVKGGELFTPKPGYILRGITRATVLELTASELEIPVHETIVSVDDLKGADEIFFTGTAAEIEPVLAYDGEPVGHGDQGPVTGSLRKLYRQATKGELDAYTGWLTYLE